METEKEKKMQIMAMLYQHMDKHTADETLDLILEYSTITHKKASAKEVPKEQIEQFRNEFKSIVYQNSQVASSNARLRQLHVWDNNGSHDKAIERELVTRDELKQKLNELLKGMDYEDWRMFSVKLSSLSARQKRATTQEENARIEINNLKFNDFLKNK